MPNPYGRPRAGTMKFSMRLPEYLLPLLVAGRPELFKPGQPGVFKYGAWGKYLLRLIMADLRDRDIREREALDRALGEVPREDYEETPE